MASPRPGGGGSHPPLRHSIATRVPDPAPVASRGGVDRVQGGWGVEGPAAQSGNRFRACERTLLERCRRGRAPRLGESACVRRVPRRLRGRPAKGDLRGSQGDGVIKEMNQPLPTPAPPDPRGSLAQSRKSSLSRESVASARGCRVRGAFNRHPQSFLSPAARTPNPQKPPRRPTAKLPQPKPSTPRPRASARIHPPHPPQPDPPKTRQTAPCPASPLGRKKAS